MLCVLQHDTEAMTQAEAEAGVVVGVEGMVRLSLSSKYGGLVTVRSFSAVIKGRQDEVVWALFLGHCYKLNVVQETYIIACMVSSVSLLFQVLLK